MNTLNKFTWIPFYEEFADKLVLYKNNRSELLKLLEEVYTHPDINNPFTDQGELIDYICPFTVIGSFNRGLTDKNRILMATEIGKRIGVKASIPKDFDGIPLLNNQQAWFFRYKEKRGKYDIDNLWEMFEIALEYAINQSKDNENKFIEYFNILKKQPLVKWNLTMGLFLDKTFILYEFRY